MSDTSLSDFPLSPESGYSPMSEYASSGGGTARDARPSGPFGGPHPNPQGNTYASGANDSSSPHGDEGVLKYVFSEKMARPGSRIIGHKKRRGDQGRTRFIVVFETYGEI